MFVGMTGETGEMSRSVVRTLNERVGGSVRSIVDGGEAVERVPRRGMSRFKPGKECNGPERSGRDPNGAERLSLRERLW